MEKGLGKALKYLEVDHFIRQQMLFEAALKTLFTKVERFLLRNDQVFVLHLKNTTNISSESSDSDLQIEDLNKGKHH